ncbi:uncharacterized protein L969DRAFT_97094 [Mixia osmundae IAM 14324]|uniref:Transcription factor tau subunit sfc6 n=1 Tax=Mixia osmundae (strain CBS 9802 / IAM 14324 / JCM 22182 / KY 12970) TaxID=764103 RepID=G7E1N5_MIXOS|nr:uncharacterized protein L969DRAFT_97094 [Mixia osmundae IAM 14324]KEI36695.1 hypothetical protein L969DRAFT_97094 [Mixia osmundae IAM 14324]GAA96745.1 hypothetical protein E5Q_03416 [Mixia osmundae IAM 14324]
MTEQPAQPSGSHVTLDDPAEPADSATPEAIPQNAATSTEPVVTARRKRPRLNLPPANPELDEDGMPIILQQQWPPPAYDEHGNLYKKKGRPKGATAARRLELEAAKRMLQRANKKELSLDPTLPVLGPDLTFVDPQTGEELEGEVKRQARRAAVAARKAEREAEEAERQKAISIEQERERARIAERDRNRAKKPKPRQDSIIPEEIEAFSDGQSERTQSSLEGNDIASSDDSQADPEQDSLDRRRSRSLSAYDPSGDEKPTRARQPVRQRRKRATVSHTRPDLGQLSSLVEPVRPLLEVHTFNKARTTANEPDSVVSQVALELTFISNAGALAHKAFSLHDPQPQSADTVMRRKQAFTSAFKVLDPDTADCRAYLPNGLRNVETRETRDPRQAEKIDQVNTKQSATDNHLFCRLVPRVEGQAEDLRALRSFESLHLANDFSQFPALLINAGAQVSSLAWCPVENSADHTYLAIATLDSEQPIPLLPDSGRQKGGIQIWQFASSGLSRPVLAMMICLDVGHVTQIRWIPAPCYASELMGTLSLVSTSGLVYLLDVPLPVDQSEEQVTVYLRPKAALAELELDLGAMISIDWISGTELVAGTTTGQLARWHVERDESLRSWRARLLAMRGCANGPIHAVGQVSPTATLATSLDGFIYIIDWRHVFQISRLNEEADVTIRAVWSSQRKAIIHTNLEGQALAAVVGRPSEIVLADGRAPYFALVTSLHHSLVALASASGAVELIDSALTGVQSSRTIYTLKRGRLSNELALFPGTSGERQFFFDDAKRTPASVNPANYAPEQAALVCAWHPSHRCTGLLASGHYNGIVRIDWFNEERDDA